MGSSRRHTPLIKSKSKSDKILFKKQNQNRENYSPGSKIFIQKEKEAENKQQNFLLKTESTIPENLHSNQNEENNIILTSSNYNFQKEEKKPSFSILDSTKNFARKTAKDISAFKFINNLGKNKEKKNMKFLKSSKNILNSKEFDSKSLENNYKMDKSSLFFRNQLINLGKMKKLNPLEQMLWAIKHNNMLKVYTIFN